MARIALATCAKIPEPDVDEQVLLQACLEAGLDARYVPWDGESVDWAEFDLVVPRSTWNYHEHETAFRRWISDVSERTLLRNPADLMLRTIHKGYLAELAAKGIPIVPTKFVSRSAPEPLSQLLQGTDWSEFVLKPAVSAASYLTRRFCQNHLPEAEAFLSQILSERDAMVQLYLPRVSDGGEANIVYIDGELTHAVVKHPRFIDDAESVSESSFQPTLEQRGLADRVMSTVREPWLYGRVDIMLTDEGTWALSELEVIEPSLFFLQHPPALERFVGALRRLVE